VGAATMMAGNADDDFPRIAGHRASDHTSADGRPPGQRVGNCGIQRRGGAWVLFHAPSELAAIRAKTDRRLTNFFCHTQPETDSQREAAWREPLSQSFKEYGIDPANAVSGGTGRAPFSEEAADALEAFKPTVVSFHFGLPPDSLMARVKSLRCTILASAATVEEARWLEQREVDGVIAQGFEAGGHRGKFLSDRCDHSAWYLCPVAPKHRGGASAGNCRGWHCGCRRNCGCDVTWRRCGAGGTADLLCQEVMLKPVNRAALKSETARQTAITNLFTGRPGQS
jgi:nitronate monooxygenase